MELSTDLTPFQLYICLQICSKNASFSVPVTFSSWHCDRCVCTHACVCLCVRESFDSALIAPPTHTHTHTLLYTLHLGLKIRIGILLIFIYITLHTHTHTQSMISEKSFECESSELCCSCLSVVQLADCGGMPLEEQTGKVCEAFRLFLQGMGYGQWTVSVLFASPWGCRWVNQWAVQWIEGWFCSTY